MKPFFNNDSVKTVKFVEAIWKLLLHSSDSHNEISNSPKKIDYSTYKNRLENDETFDKVDRTNKANELFLIRGNDDRSAILVSLFFEFFGKTNSTLPFVNPLP